MKAMQGFIRKMLKTVAGNINFVYFYLIYANSDNINNKSINKKNLLDI